MSNYEYMMLPSVCVLTVSRRSCVLQHHQYSCSSVRGLSQQYVTSSLSYGVGLANFVLSRIYG